MEKGSVYRARYRMKWAGLILFVLPMLTDLVLRHEGIKGVNYFFFFFIIDIIWTLVLYIYVIEKIWKKVKKRYIDIIIKKITNYHFICVKAISISDWDKVRIVLDESLVKYDPSSSITYFIKGAYSVGTNDIKSLITIADDIEKIKNDYISGM